MARETIITCDYCRATKDQSPTPERWAIMTYPKPDKKINTITLMPIRNLVVGVAFGDANTVRFAPEYALDLCSLDCVCKMMLHIQETGTHKRHD